MIFLELFWVFFKIGAFTFGGGYAMLPLITQQVSERGWMDTSQISEFVAISESTPGPLAVNMATYVGTQVGGVLGAVAATLGVVLPSFVIILIVAKIFDKFRKSKAVTGIMTGLKPCVVGLIACALCTLLIPLFFENGFSVDALTSLPALISALILVLCSVLSFKKVHPILLIVGSGIVGIVCGYAGLF